MTGALPAGLTLPVARGSLRVKDEPLATILASELIAMKAIVLVVLLLAVLSLAALMTGGLTSELLALTAAIWLGEEASQVKTSGPCN